MDIWKLIATVLSAPYNSGRPQGLRLTSYWQLLGWNRLMVPHMGHSQCQLQRLFRCMVVKVRCCLVIQYCYSSVGVDVIDDYSTCAGCSYTLLVAPMGVLGLGVLSRTWLDMTTSAAAQSYGFSNELIYCAKGVAVVLRRKWLWNNTSVDRVDN